MTLLGGRYVEIKMLPLSFAEYMEAFPEADPSRKYRDYLEQSGFPQTLDFQGNRQLINDYLDGIYNTIVRRDVLFRKDMRDSSQFENIARFLFDNIGSEVSVNKIFNTLRNEIKTPVQPPVINEYLDALVESYIFYKIPRWDIKGRKYLKTNAKYYTVDIGLRFALLGKEGTDSGHILENVVYLELLRRGYKVSAGLINGAEVEFVAEKNGMTEYYQVAMNVSQSSTYEREINSLNKIKDHNRKTLIVMEYVPEITKNGIIIQNALDWLLQNSWGTGHTNVP
jgi:predicted AAA+ superfamily ATPase